MCVCVCVCLQKCMLRSILLQHLNHLESYASHAPFKLSCRVQTQSVLWKEYHPTLGPLDALWPQHTAWCDKTRSSLMRLRLIRETRIE